MLKQFKVAIDGVFFQLYQTGIARVWRCLFQEFSKTDFAQHLIILDRVGTAPQIPGLSYRQIPAYSYDATNLDRELLQQVCDEEEIDLFISTYYTTPLTTPSVFMAYDMIPEVLGADLSLPMWQEKHRAIQEAISYLSISQNTAQDLIKFFPNIHPNFVTVAHCGVEELFAPSSEDLVNAFKQKYGIYKPYFILVGAAGSYKNAGLFLRAFSQLPTKQGFEMVLTGTGHLLIDRIRPYSAGSVVHFVNLADDELRLAYAGAVALVYPSTYEGFGLPVLEALACGCPVITCPNASIPEVAGEAALYVEDSNIDEMVNALCEVQKPAVRNSLIQSGLAQAQKFSWSKMAQIIEKTLIESSFIPLQLGERNLIVFPDWSLPEEKLGEQLAEVLRAVAGYAEPLTLLIEASSIETEEANYFLSSIAMQLLMEESLEASETVTISILGKLDLLQWKALLPHLEARLTLYGENQEAIDHLPLSHLPTYSLSEISTPR